MPKKIQQTEIAAPKRKIDFFKALKIGDRIQVWERSQSAPHAFARLLKIKVSAKFVPNSEADSAGKRLVEVERTK